MPVDRSTRTCFTSGSMALTTRVTVSSSALKSMKKS